MLKLYENIKRLRLENKWTQDELATRMGYTDRSTIAKIEAGKVDLSQSKILDFAKVFGIAPGDLMGWEDEIVDYVDGTYTIETAADTLDDRARKFIQNYSAASPEVRKAVDILLKVDQPDP